MIDFTWKIAGEAGFGIMTSGLSFSKIASRSGYYIFDSIEYPSLIRGGHNAYQVRVTDKKLSCQKEMIDVLVCLNKDTYEKNKQFLTENSFVIYDKEDFEIKENFKKIALPIKKVINDFKASILMRNTLTIGASLALLGGEIEVFLKLIGEEFAKKGEQVVDFNQKTALAGYNYVKDNYSDKIVNWLDKKSAKEKLVLTGNDSFSLASIVADCRLYCAYPMTPSSSVLATLASWQEKTGMIVRHPEDEISVINTAIGASFAGIRAAVGTSGGGFSLMVESISLAGITETPLVIFLGQRPGPATGMPTWTEQGDLLFAIHAGHGEFPKIVLAPGDVEEMFELTLKAYNLADIYQTPVIIISDMYLSESHQSIEKELIDKLISDYQIDRGKLINNLKTKVENSNLKIKSFLRYQISNDGISPRLIPGVKGYYYQANSYEHLEDGHTTEESLPRKQQVEKRNRKITTYLSKDFQLPKFYGDENAELVFVSWGSNKGIILEVQKKLREKNIKTGFWHFSYLYPLDKKKIVSIFKKDKKYILLENNSWGQFGKLLAAETGIVINDKILKYDGRQFMPEEILIKLI